MPYQLMHGDAISMMRGMPALSVHLVATDPPFNIKYEYDDYDDDKTHDEYTQWTYEWMTEAFRALVDSGAMWVCMGDKFAADVVVEARNAGFTLRSWCLWNYKFGTYTPHKFSRDHAHLLYFVKNPGKFCWRGEDILVPSMRQMKYKDRRANPAGRVPGSVWEFPRIAGTHPEREGWHPAQMPIAVMDRMIRACSNQGETVLDPFAGSGTTMVAAIRAARIALGIEQSEYYCKKIVERIARESAQEPIND